MNNQHVNAMQKRTPDVPSVSVSTEMKRKTPHLLYRCFFFLEINIILDVWN